MRSANGYAGLHAVHGHDRMSHGPLLYPGRTNLDTVAWSTGRLVVGVFGDDVAGGRWTSSGVRGAPSADGQSA